jgi:hypothetical protein
MDKPNTAILYYAIRRSFWYGLGFGFGFDMLIQDWLGLEGYIEFVREHWREIHWMWGLMIAASCMFLYNAMLGRFHWLTEKEEGEDGSTAT